MHRRDRGDGARPAAAFDVEADRHGRPRDDIFGNITEIIDGAPVDRADAVAGADAGAGRRAARLDSPGDRGRAVDPDQHGKGGKDQHRDDEVRHRPGSDDDRPLPQRLGLKSLCPLLGRQRQPGRIGFAARVQIAGKAHIAAQRQPAKGPAGAAPVGQPEQLAPEADGEHLRLHAEQPPGEIMAQLVQEHERADHAKEGEDRQQHAGRLGQSTNTFIAASACLRAA